MGPDSLEILKVTLTRMAGLIGLLSASAVIAETHNSRAPTDRILFWLQLGSITVPICAMLATLPAPENVEDALWGARGTQATCTVQGFVFYVGATPLGVWDVCLSVAFVLIIKYNWSDRQLNSMIRRAHWFVWPTAVLRSVIPLFYDLYNPASTGVYCTAEMVPPNCIAAVETCQRGSPRHFRINQFITSGFFVIVIFVSCASMTIITLHTRNTEQRSDSRRFSRVARSLQRRRDEFMNESSSGNYEPSSGSQHAAQITDNSDVVNDNSVADHSDRISLSNSPIPRSFRRLQMRRIANERRQRRSLKTAKKGLMYSGTLLVIYVPVIALYLFPGTAWIEVVIVFFSNVYPLYYLLVFLYQRKEMKTGYGRCVRSVVYAIFGFPGRVLSWLLSCCRPQQENNGVTGGSELEIATVSQANASTTGVTLSATPIAQGRPDDAASAQRRNDVVSSSLVCKEEPVNDDVAYVMGQSLSPQVMGPAVATTEHTPCKDDSGSDDNSDIEGAGEPPTPAQSTIVSTRCTNDIEGAGE